MEADAIRNLLEYIGDDFVNVVNLILDAKGRVVISGIGKSANIANKIVSTLNSTGTPAIFMHAADAIHGDLGNVQKDDVVIVISKSGDSPEIKVLVPLLKNMGNPVIGMVGNRKSALAIGSHHILDTTVKEEACPNNLAPTTSTTAQLAMGDALAVALMECRGFTANDFARYHPGGALGKKLYTRVEDLLDSSRRPKVAPDSLVKEAIIEISENRLGAVAVVENDRILGIVTDGDVRRMIERDLPLETTMSREIMGESPTTIESSDLAVKAFQMMEANNISQIIVLSDGAYVGIVHLHDILKEGIY
jgi:arabinose-5-phosphate isomerase